MKWVLNQSVGGQISADRSQGRLLEVLTKTLQANVQTKEFKSIMIRSSKLFWALPEFSARWKSTGFDKSFP